jgi:hypothetical protein
MANTKSDRKEKGAEVVSENALDGIAGGVGEGMQAGLNLGNGPTPEELSQAGLLSELERAREEFPKKK